MSTSSISESDLVLLSFIFQEGRQDGKTIKVALVLYHDDTTGYLFNP